MSSQSPAIVVFGATGRVGAQLAELALVAGLEVLAPARRPAAITRSHPNLRVIGCDTTVGWQVDDVLRAAPPDAAVAMAVGDDTRKAVNAGDPQYRRGYYSDARAWADPLCGGDRHGPDAGDRVRPTDPRRRPVLHQGRGGPSGPTTASGQAISTTSWPDPPIVDGPPAPRTPPRTRSRSRWTPEGHGRNGRSVPARLHGRAPPPPSNRRSVEHRTDPPRRTVTRESVRPQLMEGSPLCRRTVATSHRRTACETNRSTRRLSRRPGSGFLGSRGDRNTSL